MVLLASRAPRLPVLLLPPVVPSLRTIYRWCESRPDREHLCSSRPVPGFRDAQAKARATPVQGAEALVGQLMREWRVTSNKPWTTRPALGRAVGLDSGRRQLAARATKDAAQLDPGLRETVRRVGNHRSQIATTVPAPHLHQEGFPRRRVPPRLTQEMPSSEEATPRR